MPNQAQKTDPATEAFTSRVEMRSALTLAQVALQTLADLDAGAASSIHHALGHAIESARGEDNATALAVVDILSEVRARLSGEEPTVGEAEQVWYIE